MTRGSRPRFLVLTLFSGENEFAACRESVDRQSHPSFEHRVFENLSKSEAHARLYATIMDSRESFDLFLKLDADMVLADVDVLTRIAEVFRDIPDLDHLVQGVADWFTETDIVGVHSFSHRVRWRPNPSGLFTDPDPEFPGRKIVVRHPRPAVVHHGENPGPFQAFYFGVHRAMKACQARLSPGEQQPFAARTSWIVLNRVWRHYRRCADPRLGLAIRGADLVLDGQLPPTAVDRQDPSLIQAFHREAARDPISLRAGLESGWSNSVRRQRRWITALGPSMACRVLARSVRDGATAPVRALRKAHMERLFRRRGHRPGEPL